MTNIIEREGGGDIPGVLSARVSALLVRGAHPEHRTRAVVVPRESETAR